jgi:hypothetical protein
LNKKDGVADVKILADKICHTHLTRTPSEWGGETTKGVNNYEDE